MSPVKNKKRRMKDSELLSSQEKRVQTKLVFKTELVLDWKKKTKTRADVQS